MSFDADTTSCCQEAAPAREEKRSANLFYGWRKPLWSCRSWGWELETGCCPGGVHGQNKVSQLCPPSPQQSLCIAATPDLVLNVASGNNKAEKWFRRSGSGHQTVCTQEESPTLFCFTRRTGLNKQETPPNAYINGTVNYGFALQVSNTVMWLQACQRNKFSLRHFM